LPNADTAHVPLKKGNPALQRTQSYARRLAILEREVNSAIQFAYNATGEHTGPVYDQVAYCANQMTERIVSDVRQKAAANDHAFGGGYAEIVNRMLTAMQEKRDLLLDNFKHGMMGDHRLKKDPLVNVINTQTNSPGAIQQMGIGDNFSQTAFNKNHHELVSAIDRALVSLEFSQLGQGQKDAFSDTAVIVKEEAAKAQPDVGKLKRWGMRLVDVSKDLGMKVAASEIVHLLNAMFGG
jgi:hypothetical protein